MAQWLRPLFATRRGSRHPATGTRDSDSCIAPRNAPQVAPRQATAALPNYAPALAPDKAPDVAPKVAPGPADARRIVPAAQVGLPVEYNATLMRFDVPEAFDTSAGLLVGEQRPDSRQTHSGPKLRRVWSGTCYRKLSADDHARQLLGWLQSQPVLAGHLVPASDLECLYSAFCHAINWKPLPWQSVATELRHLTGGQRLYRRVDGRNVRVYGVPRYCP